VDQILSSWKEIASYLGKGVRTVQRWEQNLSLPVHRPAGAPRNIVFARTSELSTWVHTPAGKMGQNSSLRTILLVDPDVETRLDLRSHLEEAGYLVFACADSDRATQILERGPHVDLCILRSTSADGLATLRSLLGQHTDATTAMLLAEDNTETELRVLLEKQGWQIAQPGATPQTIVKLADATLQAASAAKLVPFPIRENQAEAS